MDKTEFLAVVQEIGSCEDDVQRRTLLANMTEGISGIFDEADTLRDANATLEQNNETLRDANMQLFLQVGQQKDPVEVQKGTMGAEPKGEEKKLSFNDLFDERGNIK